MLMFRSMFFFFFSSRRRHTRYWRDWSSDVCSSDLEWGITDAKVVNASGLPNHILGEHIYPGSSLDDDNQFSAADLALVTSHLLKEFPEVLKLSSQPEAEFNHQQIFSYNYMLKGMPN